MVSNALHEPCQPAASFQGKSASESLQRGAGNSQCTIGVQPLQLPHSKARSGVPSEGPEETSFLPITKFKAPNEVHPFISAGDPSAFFLPIFCAQHRNHGASNHEIDSTHGAKILGWNGFLLPWPRCSQVLWTRSWAVGGWLWFQRCLRLFRARHRPRCWAPTRPQRYGERPWPPGNTVGVCRYAGLPCCLLQRPDSWAHSPARGLSRWCRQIFCASCCHSSCWACWSTHSQKKSWDDTTSPAMRGGPRC